MNPSISGWIKKYFSESEKYSIFNSDNYNDISDKIREIGFSFGTIDLEALPEIYNSFNYTQEELSKICFLQLLEKCYFINNPKSTTKDFVKIVIAFYQLLLHSKKGLFSASTEENNSYTNLEKILSYRWKEHFFLHSKNNDFVLNTILLSLDILTFEAYLIKAVDPGIYNQFLTEYLVEIIIAIREQTHEQTNNDEYKIIQFLRKNNTQILPDDYGSIYSVLEKNLTADFIVCNSWNNINKEIILPDFSISPFSELKLEKEILEISKRDFLFFVAKHNFDYYYFRSSSLLNNTVLNSVSYIELLLIRNKKRLVIEIQKNTKLMALLIESTHRNLDENEKKIVKNQIIEVIKTIPSLALFLLPGGSILLPVILRFIPSLLPSSFNENK
ncbi:LETM1-related biofilm-associated protein [Myroides indicus]|uniref:LETM1-like protein n=1 Tax=Myroides indicus TaxID=1323422 RepID=A0A4R7EUY9_9FLAO|nr:LETM1-related biofilm-associated protein [Myroides indicus]TDS50949.1 LETM1-like protein [Myroides indicus]